MGEVKGGVETGVGGGDQCGLWAEWSGKAPPRRSTWALTLRWWKRGDLAGSLLGRENSWCKP